MKIGYLLTGIGALIAGLGIGCRIGYDKGKEGYSDVVAKQKNTIDQLEADYSDLENEYNAYREHMNNEIEKLQVETNKAAAMRAMTEYTGMDGEVYTFYADDILIGPDGQRKNVNISPEYYDEKAFFEDDAEEEY